MTSNELRINILRIELVRLRARLEAAIFTDADMRIECNLLRAEIEALDGHLQREKEKRDAEYRPHRP